MIAFERFSDFPDPHPESHLGTGEGSGLVERLESHLAQLNEQILRFSNLALQSSDPNTQNRCWEFARDLSGQAREIRRKLRELKNE